MLKNDTKNFHYREVLILLLCWIFWAIAQGYSWHNVAPKVDVLIIVKVRCSQLLVAYVFNLLFLYYVSKLKRDQLNSFFYYLWVFVGLSVIAYVLVMCNTSLFNYLLGRPVVFKGMQAYTAAALAKCIFLGGFTTLYFLLKNDRKYKMQQQKIDAAQLLAREAKLIMLQYQLNPHFLFNALNSIRALVTENGEKARDMITELSEFLRSVLLYNEQVTTHISNEIQIVQNYLAIQKIRFQDDLVVTFEVDDNLLNHEVPCFILQPLVENSIKFGMLTSPMPLCIRISIQHTEQELILLVSNTGGMVNKETYQTNNTGLNNITKRLELYYGPSVEFKLHETEGVVTASISINTTKNN